MYDAATGVLLLEQSVSKVEVIAIVMGSSDYYHHQTSIGCIIPVEFI